MPTPSTITTAIPIKTRFPIAVHFRTHLPNKLLSTAPPRQKENREGHGFTLAEKSVLRLILGGAAVYRCGKGMVLNTALAAEGTFLAHGQLFPRTVKPCPSLINEIGRASCRERV